MASKNRPFLAIRFAMMFACLILTVVSVLAVTRFQTRHSSEMFASLAGENLDALKLRLHDIEAALDGAAGLFHTSKNISAREWADYVAAIQIERKLPKIGGLGWIASVSKSDGTYAQLARSLQTRGFAIHPPVEGDAALVVQYVSPEDQNQAAIGLDVSFRESSRKAMEQARDSGEAVLSDPTRLVQYNTDEPCFIMFRPFFEGAPSGRGADPNAVMTGLSYAPFRSADLFSELSPAQERDFGLTVYFGTDMETAEQVFSSNLAFDAPPGFQETRIVRLYGQDFTLVWHATPLFAASQATLLPLFLGLFGLTFTVLIGLSTFTHARRTREIEREVEDQTRELKANADQTRAIVDNAMIGISLHDSTGRILSVNPAFLNMFEFEESDLVGAVLCNFIPEIPTEPWNGTIHLKSRTRSGKSLCLKAQVNEWRNKLGELRYIVLFEDITQEQAVTDHLREAEHRMNLALNAAEIGVYDIDLTTGRSVVSDSWVSLLRLDRKTMADNPQDEFLKRIHPDDLGIVLASNQECIDGTAARSQCEYRIEVAPGIWRWMKSNTSVAGTDDDGKPIRLIGSQTDFTELHDANEKLRESRSQFADIVDSAPVPLALLDAAGLFTRVNQALGRLTGYSPDELLSRNFQTLIHPADLKDMLRAIEHLRNGNVSICKVEGRCFHKSGQEMWMLLSVSRARSSGVDNDFFIAQFVDISQRKAIEKNNREFFANMSHELRTPLTSIKGAVDLVIGTASDRLPDDVRSLLSIAQGNSDRLARLLNDLLDLEKVSTRKMRFHYALHDINDVINEAVVAATPIADTGGVGFETTLPQGRVRYWTDAARLEQVLLNLLSNAVKYSDRGQTVEVSLSESKDNIVIEVRDHGSGIPDSYHDKVFQPFSQADSSATRKNGGTGLGLSIAKSLVENMGGMIDFDSAEGTGTVFRVRLPNGAVVMPSDVITQAGFIHVEPDTAFSDLLGKSLGRACTLENVATVSEGLSRVGQGGFEAIIVNWATVTPEDEAALQKFKQRNPDIRIIALSREVSLSSADLADLDLAQGDLRMDKIAKKCLWALRSDTRAPAFV